MTSLCALALVAGAGNAAEKKIIRVSTNHTDLILQVGDNGRLYQTYLGDKLRHEQELSQMNWAIHAGSDGSVTKRGWEVYSCSGNEDYFEPALGITHADGNPTTYLYYVSSSTKSVAGGTETTINLKDDKYPVSVTLHYVAYPQEDVIKTWSEISHQEKKPIKLSAYASTMLYFSNASYYLTEFSSDWAREAQMSSQQLQFGKKSSTPNSAAAPPCIRTPSSSSDSTSRCRKTRARCSWVPWAGRATSASPLRWTT